MSPPGCRPGSPPLSPAVSERQRRRLIPGVACADNGAGRAPRPVWTVPRAVGDTTRAPRRRPATMTSPSTDDRDLAALPIGMFDSGMGGLTVLHECLVSLPGENFAYVGDTARFPYGEKTREELELFAQQLTAFLETVPVKLVVVACYSATSAALPLLQERFSTPIVGVVMPGARVGAAGDGGRGGEDADAAVPRRLDRRPRARHDHAHDGRGKTLLQQRQRRRGGRVAGHDDQLDRHGLEKGRELLREELELLAGLLAVGKTRRVAHVGEVLAGQRELRLRGRH